MLGKPEVKDVERAWPEHDGAGPALLARRHDAGVFEDSQVLHDGGKRDLEWLGKFGDHGGGDGEPLHDGPAGGVRERTKDGVHVIPILSHLPKY
jgi:hypothetical protein